MARKLHLLVNGVAASAQYSGGRWLIGVGQRSFVASGIKERAGANLLTLQLKKRPEFQGQSLIQSWIDANWSWPAFNLGNIQAFLCGMTRTERVTVAKRELGIGGYL